MCLGLGKVTCPASLLSLFHGVPTMTSVKRSTLSMQHSWGGGREELDSWHSRVPCGLCLNCFPFPGLHNYSLRWNRTKPRVRATCRRSCNSKSPLLSPIPSKYWTPEMPERNCYTHLENPVKIGDFLTRLYVSTFQTVANLIFSFGFWLIFLHFVDLL